MSTPNAAHEALAIAYLSGQATDEQLAAYQNLFATDDSFRETVRDIEMWLAPLNETTEDMQPPEGLLESILAEIDPVSHMDEEDKNHDINDDKIAPIFGGDSTKSAQPTNNRKWKGLAIAASLVAVAAVGSHFVTFNSATNPETMPQQIANVQKSPDKTQQFLALLSDDSQPELVAIIYNPATNKVVARLSNVTVPKDGDLQLWLIREGQAAPQSLGVMTRAGELDQLEFDIPMTLQGGTDTLAISLERRGGSTSAAPEGPVLFTGAVSSLKRDI